MTAAGKTVNQMKKALAGNARVAAEGRRDQGHQPRRGVPQGEDRARLADQARAEAREAQKTDFSEMTASFNIKNGVAHNEDLDVKSPLFRVAGKGDIDIGNGTLDYITKATVVASTKGQGGADLDAARRAHRAGAPLRSVR